MTGRRRRTILGPCWDSRAGCGQRWLRPPARLRLLRGLKRRSRKPPGEVGRQVAAVDRGEDGPHDGDAEDHLQFVLGYDALATGIRTLPLAAGVGVRAAITGRLAPRHDRSAA